jgi:hypothetical protein
MKGERKMLGRKLGEETGRVTGRRILPGEDFRYVRMEVTYETEGTILGVTGKNMGTYVVYERLDGQMYGEGQGIIMTAEGEGAIWTGHGIGHPTGDGMGMAFASSVAFQTNSAKLADLNKCLVVLEHTIDGAGNATSVLYEWTA